MICISDFKRFVDEITKDNSRIYKMSVLEKYKNDESVRYFLDFIFNVYITSGISDKKLNKDVSNIMPRSIWLDYPGDSEIFEYIKKHNTGSDIDIKTVIMFRENFIDPALYNLFNLIITKNVQLGIDIKTINKIIPNLLPEFNVALANKYFDNPTVIEGKEFAITTKIDGGRIIAIKENGKVSFWTRAGQQYEGLVDLENDFVSCDADNIVLDGELTLLNKGTLASKDQYKETMKISRKDGIKHGLKMLVFDYIPLEDFKKQDSKIPYAERRRVLDTIFNNNKFTYFELLPILYQGTDTNKITEWLNYNIAHEEEGIMLNITNAPYMFKRSNSLLKVKKMNDLDLRVIGFEEGTNRHAGRLGAVLVDYKGNTVKVGSGFSDELREEIWNNRDKYLGTIVEVSYFETTTATTGSNKGKESLRFPVFIDFRDPWDKNTPDF